MQIMFRIILCALLKGLILTKATQDISMSEKSDHHIQNFKIDRSHSDSTARNEREIDEVPLANISIIPETNESNLNKPTSLRAFVQFDSPFTEKVKDIFVTLRWNQPEFNDEIIQGYQVQCSFFEDFKEICDDKNITAKKLEHTMHNLIFNMTYYFRIRAHTKIVAGPYTDLINVSTTHENPIPILLIKVLLNIKILDVDLKITNTLLSGNVESVVYSKQEHIIYLSSGRDLITWKINENNITKIASFDHDLRDVCIDWVARNLYFIQNWSGFDSSGDFYDRSGYSYIVKFDLTMSENGIIKFDKIFKTKNNIRYLNVLPSMGIIYFLSYNEMNSAYMMQQYHLDGKNEQIRINELFPYIYNVQDMIIDNMNNETPLIYWLTRDRIFVTDIIVSTYNQILHNRDISDNMLFQTMTIDKTNIYILSKHVFQITNINLFSNHDFQYALYALNMKYVSFKRTNAAKYVKKVIINFHGDKIHAFDKYLQPYPAMRCLTPDEKVYNFENVNATANSIIVNLPEPVVKRGCKKYNLPTTIYTISVSHCLDNNLNKSEKFNMLQYVTCERYYEIHNLTPFTEYKLKFTLSNFYFDQLSINPFDSNVIPIKTNSGRLNAPENISVLVLTPTIAVVHWMPPKELNCVVVTYEVHWKSITLVNDTHQENKQFINVPKRMADGRFFTKINLSLPVQDYLIYMRVYPMNFSNFYNESLSKIVHRYSEPNDIILSGVNINSMNISWISNINLTIFFTLEYKENAAEKWQTMNYTKMNYSNEVIYHVENLQSGTSYKFRLILRYLEYEVNFIWPADERFIFSTRGSKHDILSTPGIITKKYYLLFMLSFFVIIIIICICYFYYLHRQHRGNDELFFYSTMTDMELAILHEVPYAQLIYNNMLHCNPDKCAITEIARKQITFTKRLGSGAFGKVFQGKVKNLEKSGTELSVAIKTLPKNASSHEIKNLLKEAELMSRFQHKHILRLLGVCLDGDSPLLVLELMETDLLKYLRDCRNLQASDSSALRLQDLLAMCEDVARSCCYLEELHIVHRDLACRNCLVSSRNRENRIIKIADFGLARDIYNDDYYRMKGEDLLPIRWMAPESLMIKIFTSQSDVWSFGVLMWEITSLGGKPYMDKTDNEVIYHVRAGGRLPITPNCPSPLYELMLRCWYAADARPNFKFCLKNIIALRKNMEDALLSPVDTI